jgi:hypothetical protein
LEEGIEPTASADGTEITEATDNPETPVVE